MTFILCYPIVLQEPLKALKGNTIRVSIENIGGGHPGEFGMCVGVNYFSRKICWGQLFFWKKLLGLTIFLDFYKISSSLHDRVKSAPEAP